MLILAGILIFLSSVILMVMREKSTEGTILNSLGGAAIVSLLIYIGSKAAGLSIPQIDWNSEAQEKYMNMNTFFNLLTHLLILTGILVLLSGVILMVMREKSTEGTILRSLAAVVGLFIYIGAKAVGLSIPQLAMATVQVGGSPLYRFIAVLCPSVIGLLAARFILSHMDRSEDIAARIIVLIMAFIMIMFGDVYAATYSTNVAPDGLNKALLPNLSFVVSLALYIVLKYENPIRKHPIVTTESPK